MNKLYVGNLPFGVEEDELKNIFSAFGDVTEATIIRDKFSGRSKGFGFVTFANEDSAKQAVAEMNGKEVQGRQIKVSEAKPMEENRPRRSFNRRREF